MEQSRPSLAEIARRARVSAMTVSRALRGQPGVAVELAARIRRLAASVGYRPNPLVQALMAQVRGGRVRRGTNVIAMLVPQLEEPGWGHKEWVQRLIRGAEQRAATVGFRLEPFYWQRAEMADKRIDEILQARGIRGVVVGPLARPGADLHLDWNRYAVAAIGATLAQPRLHRVRNHAFHSAQLAVARLRAAGCQRIGLALSLLSGQRADQLWQAGFLLADHAQPPRARAALIHQPPRLERDEFFAWFRRARPDGLLLVENLAYTWLREARIPVPARVAVAQLNRNTEPAELAGVDQHLEAVGAAAVDLVVERLYHNEFGVPDRPKDVLIEGSWVAGTTVPPARAEKPLSRPSPRGRGAGSLRRA
ncbi:MAG: LacI family DNA-binding transcriptional regulator [Opitutae bacterium]|nr:LacI family DNA-binding transcriptional regulator [Opitutae bacterium]